MTQKKSEEVTFGEGHVVWSPDYKDGTDSLLYNTKVITTNNQIIYELKAQLTDLIGDFGDKLEKAGRGDIPEECWTVFNNFEKQVNSLFSSKNLLALSQKITEQK